MNPQIARIAVCGFVLPSREPSPQSLSVQPLLKPFVDGLEALVASGGEENDANKRQSRHFVAHKSAKNRGCEAYQHKKNCDERQTAPHIGLGEVAWLEVEQAGRQDAQNEQILNPGQHHHCRAVLKNRGAKQRGGKCPGRVGDDAPQAVVEHGNVDVAAHLHPLHHHYEVVLLVANHLEQINLCDEFRQPGRDKNAGVHCQKFDKRVLGLAPNPDHRRKAWQSRHQHVEFRLHQQKNAHRRANDIACAGLGEHIAEIIDKQSESESQD